jgi:hypothetical protein
VTASVRCAGDPPRIDAIASDFKRALRSASLCSPDHHTFCSNH